MQKRRLGKSQSNPTSEAEDIRKRINRPESAVRQMISAASDGEKSKDGLPSPVLSSILTHSTKIAKGTGGQKIFVDTRSSYWDTILNDVSI